MPRTRAGTRRRDKRTVTRRKPNRRPRGTVTVGDLVRTLHQIELEVFSVREALGSLDQDLPVPLPVSRAFTAVLMKKGQC
jgi:hypothetical protein